MAGLNPYNFRAVPIDPDSRLPADAEVVPTGLAYDFGAARPQRILKSAPGNRAALDKEATMRYNLHTVGGGDERDLQGTWAQDARGLGSSTGAAGRKSGRPSSAHHSRRSDTNRQNSGSRITASPGRFAHGVSVSGADMAAAGLEQHLSNLDIGAGTPGDSMVTQFALYKTPLTQPFMPSAAVAASVLQADPRDPRPMQADMFAAGISELRVAAGAVAPAQPVVRARSVVEKEERARAKMAREGGTLPASEAKQSIDAYLSGAKALRQSSSSSSSASAAARSERERTKYEERVRKLEKQLLHMKSDAERAEAQEQWQRAERTYQAAAGQAVTGGNRRSGAIGDLDDPAAADEGDPNGDAASRHAAHVSQLHRALSRGETLSSEFVEGLHGLQAAHRANLAAVEDLYYQQKLTGKLSSTLVNNSQQQMELLASTGGAAAAATIPRAGGGFASPQQLHQQQHRGHVDPYPDLHEVSDPRELAFRMGQSLRRDPRQRKPGVADADDPRENLEKKRLAATFEQDYSDDGSAVEQKYAHRQYEQRGARRTSPHARGSGAPSGSHERRDHGHHDDHDDADSESLPLDEFGRPVWREVRDDNDERDRLDERRQRAQRDKEKGREREKEQRGGRDSARRRHERDAKRDNERKNPGGRDRHDRDRHDHDRDREDEESISVDLSARSSGVVGPARSSGRRRADSRDRSHSRSRSRSDSRDRGDNRSRSRSRSPRARHHSRSRSRSRSPSNSEIARGMRQPKPLSSSQRAAKREAEEEEERRERRRERGSRSSDEEAEDRRRSYEDARDREEQYPRDIAPEVDDGTAPPQQHKRDAAAALLQQARKNHSIGGRPATAGGVRDRSHSRGRPRSASGPRPGPVRMLDPDEVFPRGEHNARARAEVLRSHTPVNQAHAFGPGRPILDEYNRPLTADAARARTRSRSRGRGLSQSVNGAPQSGDESDGGGGGGGSRSQRLSRTLTEPQPFHMSSSPSPSPSPSSGGGGGVPTSRTKQRFLEYLSEVKAREEEHLVLASTFKANPLPTSTMQPLYGKMVAERKERSKQQKRDRKALTQSLVKPFEFAATRAIEERKKKKLQQQQGGASDDDDASDSGVDSISASDKRSRRKSSSHKQSAGKGSDDGTVGALSDGGDDAGTHSDATSDAPSQASYKVAFGFTTRDDSRPRWSPNSGNGGGGSNPAPPPAPAFKANKIPWSSQVSMLDSIVKEREKAREQRVRDRAKQLLASSALPRRMEMHKKKQEKEAAAKSTGDEESDHERRKKKKFPPEPTYQPQVNASVPDFDRLHSEFATDLARVKRSKALTRVAEFDITKPRARAVEREEPRLFKAKPYVAAPPPDGTPLSTKKTDEMTAKTRAAVAAREAKAAAAEALRLERLKQNPEMTRKLIPKIAAAHAHGAATTDDTIRELTKAAKRDMKEKDAAWAERVNEMKQRVRSRPLLVESYNNAAGRMEARKKALLAIKESLDKAGIEDQTRFFDPQELADLDLKF